MTNEELGIPKAKAGRPAKYPFKDMKVGADETVECKQGTENKVRAAAYSAGSYHKMKFVCRNVEGGVKVWRVK